MKNALLLTLVTLALVLPVSATLRYSTGSGDWSNNSTWTGNTVPQCGDSIVIQETHTITVTSQETYNCTTGNIKIVVKGKLYFSSGNKLNLSCGSQVFVYPTGEVNSPANGSSNRINICGLELWSSANGKMTGPACLPANGPNCNGVLPVELKSFEAAICTDAVCLTWSTASENNNSHFNVEKMVDGKFIAIDSVLTKSKNGMSKYTLNYNYSEVSPSAGLNYYRLKQIDTDKSFNYSKIVTVNVTAKKENITVYPNPNNGSFYIRSGSENVNGSRVVITNSFGNTFFETIFTGENTMFVSQLSTGMYFMSILENGVQKVQRIVVQ